MRIRPIGALGLVLALALAAGALPALAQRSGTAATLDRSVQPTPGKPSQFIVPKWTHLKLANGAELVVSEKHDLPLVAVNISFVGGTYNYEPAGKLGVASFTAQMLSEGTATRTGDQINDAQHMLGTTIFAGITGEAGTMGFTALKDKLDPALALMADMLLHPSFPSDALERLRSRTIVNLTQSRDQPNTIASNVFAKLVYGDAHPYGRVVTENTVRAITRDDLLAFHKDYYRPGRAVITVSGDINVATARAAVEKALKDWPAGGERPAFTYPQPAKPNARTIYLIDKPKAAQSVFALGLAGPPRNTPDYYALQVMNNILGVLFQSRLNHNIREVKGYSYGVNSNFAYGRGPGAFRAGGGIVTAKSDSALIEFMNELRGVQGSVPFTADEIEQGKGSLIQGVPRRFASVNAIGASVGSIYAQDLGETFLQEYAAKINAVTSDDLVRVAKKYIDLDHLNIVVVGDRAAIESDLRKTGIAPVVLLDADGRPVVVP